MDILTTLYSALLTADRHSEEIIPSTNQDSQTEIREQLKTLLEDARLRNPIGELFRLMNEYDRQQNIDGDDNKYHVEVALFGDGSLEIHDDDGEYYPLGSYQQALGILGYATRERKTLRETYELVNMILGPHWGLTFTTR